MIALVHRIVLPDGGVRWQEWAHHAVMDASGAVLEYQAVGRDVTGDPGAVEAPSPGRGEVPGHLRERASGHLPTTAAAGSRSSNQVMASMLGFSSPEEVTREVTDIGRQFYDDPERRRDLLAAWKRPRAASPSKRSSAPGRGAVHRGLHVSAVRDEAGRLVSLIGLMDGRHHRPHAHGRGTARSERTARTLLNATTELAFLVTWTAHPGGQRYRRQASRRAARRCRGPSRRVAVNTCPGKTSSAA
jgi:hypothetical protein